MIPEMESQYMYIKLICVLKNLQKKRIRTPTILVVRLLGVASFLKLKSCAKKVLELDLELLDVNIEFSLAGVSDW